MDNESLLTTHDVCDYLGVSVTLLNSLEKKGHLLPARKLPMSNKRLYKAEDVMKFKESVQANANRYKGQ